MCLGIPGRLVESHRHQGLLMGKVDFGSVFKEVCLENTPEAAPGDYVIVHVGFSLSIVDAEEAAALFQFLERMGGLAEDDEAGQPEPQVT
jgi:hydrogenase expression/formation protein HypC